MNSQNPPKNLRLPTNSESKAPPLELLDFLFAVLFLTSFGCLIAGNLLMWNKTVLQSSVQMWIPLFGLLLIYGFLSRISKSPLVGFILLSLVLVFFLWFRKSPYIAPIFYFLMAFSGVYLAKFLRIKKEKVISLLLMAALGTIVSLSVYNQFSDFNNLNAARSGFVHKDVFFHSSISAMIKNYGVVSTGLHGLVETPYYVFAHCFVAFCSLIAGNGVFEVFGIISHVFFIPLLIFAACAAAVGIQGAIQKPNNNIEIYWLVACVLLVAPQLILSRWMFNGQYLFDFPDQLGKAIFLLALPLVFIQRLRAWDVALSVVMLLLIANTKLATAVMFGGLWGARWILCSRGKGVKEFTAFLLCAVILYYFMGPQFEKSSNSESFNSAYRFEFLQASWKGYWILDIKEKLSRGEWLSLGLLSKGFLVVGSFILFHYFISWLTLSLLIYKEGIKSIFSSIPSLIVLSSIFGSLFFVFYMNFLDPNAVNPFTSCAFFVAMPVLCSLVGDSRKQIHFPLLYLIMALTILLLSFLSYKSFARNSRVYALHRVDHKSSFIDSLLEIRNGTPTDTLVSADSNVWELKPVLWGSLYYVGLAKRYGDWMHKPWRTAAPLVFPAISERPWVGVIPPNSSNERHDSYNSYGYLSYEIDRVNGGVKTKPILHPNMKTLPWEYQN